MSPEFLVTVVPLIQVPFLILLVFYLYLKRLRDRSIGALRAFQNKYGDRLLLAAGCGIVTRSSRIPGIVALTRDTLVYQGAYDITGGQGEYQLDSIERVDFEPVSVTGRKRASKYGKGEVMAVIPAQGDEFVFVLSSEDGISWRAVLQGLGVSVSGR